jgi:glycosyltransferase involved in cell wall biosynthesis
VCGVRILYIAENLDRPEAHLIAGVAAEGHDISLLMPPTCGTPVILETVVTRYPVRLKSRIDRDAIRTIRQAVERYGIELVHCLRSNRPVANALPALRGKPTKIVCYRGTLGNVSRWNPGDWLTYLNRRLDRIACVSRGVQGSLAAAGVAAEKLVTIYKGHDPDWYRTELKPDLSALGIPRGAFVVACAANMRRLKGTDTLIESLAHVTSERPVHLLLIGEVRDPLVKRLAADARFAGRVHLAGFRDDAAALSGACDVCAMASRRREGLPRAVIEAMSQSIPAVVTDVGGMPELVVHETSGLVVPPDNPAALGAAISRMANDDAFRTACATEARRRIATAFSITRTIEQTLEMYEDVGPSSDADPLHA